MILTDTATALRCPAAQNANATEISGGARCEVWEGSARWVAPILHPEYTIKVSDRTLDHLHISREGSTYAAAGLVPPADTVKVFPVPSTDGTDTAVGR